MKKARKTRGAVRGSETIVKVYPPKDMWHPKLVHKLQGFC
ncbi:MAG: hypothetical protein ACJAQU_002399 [Loktanella salsilacus]|jgi:hypothetical protein|tara:strand:- start:2630 stop:2749 length:120 start_codon:yes stop_codon:yes gene_type:complete